jgi:hypothetical protein
MAWREEVFYPAFQRAGMLKLATVVLAGESVTREAYVDFCKPDVNPMTGVQSSDYEIEFQAADFPGLSEDDQVIIDGEKYIVRDDSRVAGLEATGFYRKALLTKQDAC